MYRIVCILLYLRRRLLPAAPATSRPRTIQLVSKQKCLKWKSAIKSRISIQERMTTSTSTRRHPATIDAPIDSPIASVQDDHPA